MFSSRLSFQQASELGHSLNEGVLKPAQEKRGTCLGYDDAVSIHQVKEGKIFDDVSSGFSELAAKVQGVGSRGWRDVATFFSGRAEDPLDRAPEGRSCQNSGGDSSHGTTDRNFWETFGSTDPARAHRSPSGNSWTCADPSADKRSSDGWDAWGSGPASASSNRDGDDMGGGEAWGRGAEGRTRARAVKEAAPPAAVDDGWDNQDW
ncbi:hypothetical protein J1605_012989 [Eschrichtius robustus]|uniref:ADP-ribosylation factor GTPase-activating protein 1 n=1 Tax=Eschrichtius robustus TaxID=9764 RepID=A0AB34GJ74_ESCRO|nr:hypothetical protein J1605_012989 [Eschrichtius robustus]